MIVPYSHVLCLAGVLFAMGIVCAVARRNLIMMLIGVEIMLNAAGLASSPARGEDMTSLSIVAGISAVVLVLGLFIGKKMANRP